MSDRLRRVWSGFLLAVMLSTLSGPASGCCTCGPHAARVERKCPRCDAASPSGATAQLSRASCCRAKVSEAAAALTPAPLLTDRAASHLVVVAVLPMASSNWVSDAQSARAPPGLATRCAAQPAAPRTDILRL